MLRSNWISKLFVTAITVCAVGGTARAGIIPASVTITPESGNFRWTYSIVLPTNMSLQSGNYFTIYNVGGLIPGTITTPSNWTVSSAMNTPAPVGVHPHDNGTTPDLTFVYTGPTIPTGQVGLGNFWFDSSSGTSTTVDFVAQNPVASTGNIDRNIVSTLAPASSPVNPTGVPEPTTLALAGLGLPLVGAVRAWRRKK